ncbi:hypothetical protein Aperf_G00000109611 [Anoplocephala perfoliata]
MAGVDFNCLVSFLSLLQTLFKVLDIPKKKAKVGVFEDAKNEVQVVGLRHEPVCSFDDVLRLLKHFSDIRTSGQTSANQHSSRWHAVFQGGVDTSSAAEFGDGETAERGQTVWDNEKEGVAYSYSMFHFLMFLATLFVMMSITNWYSPDTRTGLLSANYASFWIKAISSWACASIYIWTLVAPSLFPDRDFS